MPFVLVEVVFVNGNVELAGPFPQEIANQLQAEWEALDSDSIEAVNFRPYNS